MISLFALILVASVLLSTLVQTESRIGYNDRIGKQAMAHAQAGIEHAVQLLEANFSGSFTTAFNGGGASGGTQGGLQSLSGEDTVTIDGLTYRTRSFAGGSYNVRIDDNYDDTPNNPAADTDSKAVVTSIGTMGTAVREIEALVTMVATVTNVPGSGGWPYGMFGVNKVTISGGSTAFGPIGGGEVAVASSNDITVSSSYVHGVVQAGDQFTCSGSCEIYDGDGNLCYSGDGEIVGQECVTSGLGSLGTFESESPCHADLNPDGSTNADKRYSPDADDGLESITNNIYTVNLDAAAADAFLRSDTPQPVVFESVADWFICDTDDFDSANYDPNATSGNRGAFCTNEQPADYTSADGKMEHGGKVVVAKSGEYCFSKLTLSGGAMLFLDVNDGPIVIHVSDSVAASGGSSVNGVAGGNFFSTSGNPEDVTIIQGAPGRTVAVSGGSGSAMMVYNPTGKVTLSSGSGNYTGSVIGIETTLSGGGEFHYGGSGSGGTVVSYSAVVSAHEVH